MPELELTQQGLCENCSDVDLGAIAGSVEAKLAFSSWAEAILSEVILSGAEVGADGRGRPPGLRVSHAQVGSSSLVLAF